MVKNELQETIENLFFVAAEIRATAENVTEISTTQEAKLKDLQSVIMQHQNDVYGLAVILKKITASK